MVLPSCRKRLNLMNEWHFFNEITSVSALMSFVECHLSAFKRVWKLSRYSLAELHRISPPSSITRVWGKCKQVSNPEISRWFSAVIYPSITLAAIFFILLFLFIFFSRFHWIYYYSIVFFLMKFNPLHERKNTTIETVSKIGGHTIQSSIRYPATSTHIIINPVAPDPNRRKLQTASSPFIFTRILPK